MSYAYFLMYDIRSNGRWRLTRTERSACCEPGAGSALFCRRLLTLHGLFSRFWVRVP